MEVHIPVCAMKPSISSSINFDLISVGIFDTREASTDEDMGSHNEEIQDEQYLIDDVSIHDQILSTREDELEIGSET